MTSPMHEYQLRCVQWMNQRSNGYLAIDMGLGKTRIVLEYFRQYQGQVKALIVAPLRVIQQTWPEEIRKWAPELTYTILHGKDKDLEFRKDVDLYLLNYDGLKWFKAAAERWGRGKWLKGILILDEATMVKASQSLRFKVFKELRAVFAKCFALSATPAPNGYQDLWSQYFLLDYGRSLGPSKTQFFNRYFITLESRRIVPQAKDRLREIEQRIAPATFRLDANDYIKLPEFVCNDRFIELPDALVKQYKSLQREFCLELDKLVTVTATNAAILSNKLRQFCQGGLYSDAKGTVQILHDLKVQALKQIIEELQGQPTLVAIQYKFELELIRAEFPGVPAISGGSVINTKETQDILDKWNRGKLPILVCHPASLSHGVNLQAGGHYITWLALPWSLEQYQQLNGRLRRQGQKNRVVLNRVLIRGSVEERVAAALNKKDTTQIELLDALRHFTKEVLTQA